MKYLVTGGAGFIGSHIAEALVRDGLGEVVVFDNFSTGYEHNIEHLHGRLQVIKGDVRNMKEVAAAMEGVDIVFHEAAFVSAFDSFNRPQEVEEINVGGTMNVFEAASAAGVTRVVFASSASIYGPNAVLPQSEDLEPDPQSPYAHSKIQGEQFAKMIHKREGLETVCLRYFNVYGPRQDPSSEYSGVLSRFKEALAKGEQPVIYGSGEQTRDFVFVGDAVRMHLLAAMSDKCCHGEAINVATGKETSLNDIIGALEKVLNRKLDPISKPERQGDIPRSVADISRAKELLGFEPEVSLEDGLGMLLRS